MDIRRTAFTDPVAQALVAELQQEFVVRYGGPDETPLDPTLFDPPTGAFFVGCARRSSRSATGAWRLRPRRGGARGDASRRRSSGCTSYRGRSGAGWRG